MRYRLVGVDSLARSIDDHYTPDIEPLFSELSRQWWEGAHYTGIVKDIRIAAQLGRLRPITILTSGPISENSVDSLESELYHAADVSGTNLPDGLLSWHALNHELSSCSLSRIKERMARAGAQFVGIGDAHAGDDATSRMYDARSAAQSYVDNLPGDPIICWLDSDLEFSALVQDGDLLTIKQPWPWVHMVWYQSQYGEPVDVAVGDVTGDPPIPSSSTLLTNLMDLAQKGEETNGSRWSIRDPAYDLSEIDRPKVRFPSIGTQWTADPHITQALLWRGTLNRPLVASPTILSRPHRPWFVRGGVTVVFNRAVMQTPTPRFVFAGRKIRRGDSFWLVRNLKKHGFTAGHFPFPLLHRRTHSDTAAEEMATSFRSRFFADLFGAAALKGAVVSNTQHGDSLHHHVQSALRTRASRSANVLNQSLRTLAQLNGTLNESEAEQIHRTLTETLSELASLDLHRAAEELSEQIEQYMGVDGVG